MAGLDQSPELDELIIQADRATLIGSIGRGIVHDLRGPLQIFTLLGHSASDQGLAREASALLEATRDASDRLAATVGHLALLLTPGASGPGPVDLASVLDQVRQLEQYMRGAPAVELALDIPGRLPAVRAVEPALRHALLSLLLNAKDATGEASGGRIAVRVELGEREKDGVRVIIEDRGAGLAESAIEQVFDPRYTTKAGRTLGLGLPAARRLIERCGGSLSLSRSNPGTQAVVQLARWVR